MDENNRIRHTCLGDVIEITKEESNTIKNNIFEIIKKRNIKLGQISYLSLNFDNSQEIYEIGIIGASGVGKSIEIAQDLGMINKNKDKEK